MCLNGASLNQWNRQVKGFDLYLYPLFTLKEREKSLFQEDLASIIRLPSNGARSMFYFEMIVVKNHAKASKMCCLCFEIFGG